LFVTGGTGFVGKWLVETFLAANAHHRLGAQAVVLTRDIAAFRTHAPWIAEAPGLELVEGDVRRFSFPDGDFSHLIHAAADMAVDAAPLEAHDIVVRGSLRVLEFAATRRIPDLLLVSSGAVYGPQPAEIERLTEKFVGAPSLSEPATAYGQGKREAEWLMHAYAEAHGLRCRVARLFSFTGPYLPPAYAAASFVGDLLAERPINVAGDGTSVRSYLYAADMAIWLWTALLRGPPGLVCNVGGEDIISMADLAAMVSCFRRPALPVHIAQADAPARAAQRYVPSVSYARHVLGVAPLVLLEDGLRRMISSRQIVASGRRNVA
jgi:dTDP-glucose 4,6-dehydratase